MGAIQIIVIDVQKERAKAKNKLNRNDDIVKAGCGTHVPNERKRKRRDKWKKDTKKYLDR